MYSKKNPEPAAELEKLSKNSAKFFNSFGEFPNFCRILPHLPLPVLKRCFLSSCPGSDAVMFLGMERKEEMLGVCVEWAAGVRGTTERVVNSW